MTRTAIQVCISSCIEIQREIAELKALEKDWKAKLTAEASYREDEHAETEGGGWSWSAQDEEGNLVRVTQPIPSLKSKLDPEAKTFARIKELTGRDFMPLFQQVPAYKPVEDFRQKAERLLGPANAKKLLKLVTTESAITVSFEVAQKEAA